MKRGDLYWGDLDPHKGSEQAGQRPVLIFQDDATTQSSPTVVVIPFTSNLNRTKLPTCVLVKKGVGGLRQDSVALCHQIRVLDKQWVSGRIGTLPPRVMHDIEDVVMLMLGLH